MMVVWLLPMSLRAKMAAVVLLGIFFIPLATSDRRGLTHILTCQDEVSTTLFINNDPDAPVLGSADSVTSDNAGLGLCGGLIADIQILGVDGTEALVRVAVTNNSEYDWHGSMEVHFDGTPVPVSIGSIKVGATEDDLLHVKVPEGSDVEIDANLRIGL